MKDDTKHIQPKSAVTALFVLAVLIACSAAVATDADLDLLKQARELFEPLPANFATEEFPIPKERVELGRLLYFDPRISADGTSSCARCHLPALYGTDGLRKSIGVKARQSPRNAPTVLNSASHFVAHWIGDRKNIEDQATKSLLGPASYGQPDYAAAMRAIAAIAAYRELFQKAFPGDPNPISPDNWGKAIGAYERTLVTPAPFDAYLKGDTRALPPTAQAGLRKFISYGCTSCHNGVGVGGSAYRKFGLLEDYWKVTGSEEIDEGRYKLTQDLADRYVFKVPSLRNVAMTAPYFHDGSVATLPEAVRIMARLQLGRQLSDEDVDQLAAFLGTLTGPLPEQFATVPILPAAAVH